MEFNIEKIIRIKRIRMEKSILSEEENALSEPILTDQSLICKIYQHFTCTLNEMGCPPNPKSVTQRKKFIFIILYLYSPSTLAGGKMARGLREELSKTLGVQSTSTCLLYTSDAADD